MTPTECERLAGQFGLYVDAEIAPKARAQVEAHLQVCDTCRRSCEELQQLKERVAGIALPEPASLEIYDRIETALQSRGQRAQWRAPFILSREVRLAAATFVVALALGYGYPYLAERSNPAPRAAPLVPPVALTVGDYVQQVRRGSPDAFWNRYAALDADLRSVAEPLDFNPRIPRQLSGGYELTGAKLLKDVCCYTVQLRYESAGRVLDVFQCHDGHPVSFGRARSRRLETQTGVYTSLAWEGTSLVGRVFSDGDVNIILVGQVEDHLADRITEEFLNAGN